MSIVQSHVNRFVTGILVAMSSSQLRNFHQQIVDALGSSIVAGHFAEGIQLPTEPELANTYGASRLIIREAMKSLAAKGLVSIRPRTGTHVLPRSKWNLFDPSVLDWYARLPPDKKLMADLMELRQAIEPQAAHLAALRAEQTDIETLQLAYQAMSCANNRADYIEADLRFHGAVVHASGNVFFRQLEMALSAVWTMSFRASSDQWGPDPQALALHKTLLDAIGAHDPTAAENAVLALIDRAVMRIGE